MICDSNLATIQVFVKDLRSALDASNASESYVACPYDINELVTLSTTNVGVVLLIDKDSVTVLTQTGEQQKVKMSQVQGKMNTSRSITSDSSGNAVSVGDQIQVQSFRGEIKQRGNVMHIYKSFVFCRSKEHSENGGIFVAKANSLHVVNTRTSQPVQSNNSNGNNNVSILFFLEGIKFRDSGNPKQDSSEEEIHCLKSQSRLLRDRTKDISEFAKKSTMILRV